MTRLQRLFRIAWVFCRYRLDTFLPLAELPAPLKVFFLLAPWHLFPKPKLSRGDRLRLAMEAAVLHTTSDAALMALGTAHCLNGWMHPSQRSRWPLKFTAQLWRVVL